MNHEHAHTPSHGSLLSYLLGFTLSIVLTAVAFALAYLHIVSDHVRISHTVLYTSLLICAIMQLFVQVFFFLHVGKESKSQKNHWNLTALIFALVVVLILVGGTLWIMANLQHTNMTEPFENGVVTPQTEG